MDLMPTVMLVPHVPRRSPLLCQNRVVECSAFLQDWADHLYPHFRSDFELVRIQQADNGLIHIEWKGRGLICSATFGPAPGAMQPCPDSRLAVHSLSHPIGFVEGASLLSPSPQCHDRHAS